MQTLTSPVTWTLVATFVFGGLTEITGILPASWSGVITLVLAVLGTYLHHDQIKTGKI